MTKDLDERLRRLKKSYEKLPIQSEPKQIMNKISTVKKETRKTKKKSLLPLPALVFVTFLFLGTISTIWILNNPTMDITLPNSKEIQIEKEDEKYQELMVWIRELEEQYEMEVNRHAKELGLTKEQVETLIYVQSGYSTIKFTFDLIEGKELPYLNFHPMEWEQRIMESIRTPKELLQDLAKKQKLSILEEHAFLSEYGDKVKQLNTLYNELLITNNYEFNNHLLEQQGFILSTNNKGQNVQYVYSDIESLLSEKLSPSALSYIDSLSMQPYFYAGDFLYSIEGTVQSMIKLETLLLDEDYEQFYDYELLKLYYQSGIFKLLTGTETYQVKENNTYSTTFLSVLNKFIEQDSAVSELAKMILLEIETNNHSKTIENLTYDQIWMEVSKKKYDDINLQVK